MSKCLLPMSALGLLVLGGCTVTTPSVTLGQPAPPPPVSPSVVIQQPAPPTVVVQPPP